MRRARAQQSIGGRRHSWWPRLLWISPLSGALLLAHVPADEDAVERARGDGGEAVGEKASAREPIAVSAPIARGRAHHDARRAVKAQITLIGRSEEQPRLSGRARRKGRARLTRLAYLWGGKAPW